MLCAEGKYTPPLRNTLLTATRQTTEPQFFSMHLLLRGSQFASVQEKTAPHRTQDSMDQG